MADFNSTAPLVQLSNEVHGLAAQLAGIAPILDCLGDRAENMQISLVADAVGNLAGHINESLCRIADRIHDEAQKVAPGESGTSDKSLGNVIRTIDGLSAQAFTEIGAVANLAIKALETDPSPENNLIVIKALRGICNRACETSDSINFEAGTVGFPS